MRFTGLPSSWLPWLVAGQHLHAGENTHYGLGRYSIRELGEVDAFTPARTTLDTLSDVARLDQALDHVLGRSQMRGVDRVSPQVFADERDERLRRLAGDLRTGRYRLSPLLGLIDRKPTGGLRALVVPTVADRVAQRAVALRLGPAIDTLLDDCAYAYRQPARERRRPARSRRAPCRRTRGSRACPSSTCASCWRVRAARPRPPHRSCL